VTGDDSVVSTAARAAAEAAVFLRGRSAEELGWPERGAVAMHLATAVLGGLSSRQYGSDPQGWCLDTLQPAIERRLNGIEGDLREVGWPHAPTLAAAVVGWLVQDAVIAG